VVAVFGMVFERHDRAVPRKEMGSPMSVATGPPTTRTGSVQHSRARLKEALLGSTAGTPVEIWFQDEARVGQKGTLSYVWGPVASRPPMVRDNRHDTAYILGAICPARGIGAAIITPAANTECINLHLAEISTHIAPGAIAALIWDGAGWHQSGGEL
jgi:hypothetical protein